MSIFPQRQLLNQVDSTPVQQPRSLRTYAFDFESSEFRITPSGKPVFVDGEGAIMQNTQKALSTERYTFPIYSSFYGHELRELIRMPGTREWKQAEAERLVTEAVIHLYGVERCEGFTFEWERAALRIGYRVVTSAGEQYEQEVEV